MSRQMNRDGLVRLFDELAKPDRACSEAFDRP
jgi:hypothetical protein